MQKPIEEYGPTDSVPAPPPPVDEEEDDFDLFGSEDEEEVKTEVASHA